MTRLIPLLSLCYLATLCLPGTGHAANALERFTALESSAMVLLDDGGNVIASKLEDKSLVPASTTKLITAWLAIEHWGEDHRFGTAFHLDRASGTLWVKAAGDPFLVSEELQLIAAKIAALSPGRVKRIALDVSLFKPDLVVPGASTTNNPYDAIPTAIAANFNTLNLKKNGTAIESAEDQTPLTPFSRSFSGAITGSSLRINTGRQSQNAERYFAELLAAILRNQGIDVDKEITWGSFPAATADFVHYNSRTVGEVIQLMLKYSTNFIANQLVLALVAEVYQRPADFSLVRDYLTTRLKQHFGWRNFALFEGAGLSPRNRLSANQLIELLRTFSGWSHLLPEVNPGIFAKTGTLNNVSTLAGYIKAPGKPLQVFVLMVNEKVPRSFVQDVAVELATQR